MNKVIKKSTIFLCLAFFSLLGSTRAEGGPIPFEVAGGEEMIKIAPGESTFVFSLYARMPDGHFLYKEKTEFKISDTKGALEWTGVDWPPTILHDDPFLNKTVEVWQDPEIEFEIKFKIIDASKLPTTVSGTVVLQGCSQNLCYRPVKRAFQVEVVSSQDPRSDFDSGLPPRSSSHDDKMGDVFATSFWPGLGLSFVAGVATDFTPCVLPIIPLILLFIGVSVKSGEEKRGFKNLFLSLFLVLGMSLTYAVLGLLAVFLGFNLGFIFQSQWVVFFLAAFFFAMALSLFGVFDIRLPHRLETWATGLGGKGFAGSFIAGSTIGFVALPCVGPLIGALLLYVAESRDFLKGAVYLFSYGLGMGSLFIFLALFYERGRALLKGARFGLWIKRAMGLIFLLVALYYAGIAIKGMVENLSTTEGKRQSDGIWETDFEIAQKRAKAEAKPLVLDFRADWCIPCLEMEAKTFADPRVREILKTQVVPLRVDCTRMSEACEALTSRYQVVGFPTLLFLDSDGNRIPHLEPWAGYMGPEEFLFQIGDMKK